MLWSSADSPIWLDHGPRYLKLIWEPLIKDDSTFVKVYIYIDIILYIYTCVYSHIGLCGPGGPVLRDEGTGGHKAGRFR